MKRAMRKPFLTDKNDNGEFHMATKKTNLQTYEKINICPSCRICNNIGFC